MSILTAELAQEDDVFAAFAQGLALNGATVHSTDLGAGNHALVSHGVTVALRSDETVVFDARPHAAGCPCVCRVMAHVGRAGVHVHEHFADDEVSALDHGAFVALTTRLGGAL